MNVILRYSKVYLRELKSSTFYFIYYDYISFYAECSIFYKLLSITSFILNLVLLIVSLIYII